MTREKRARWEPGDEFVRYAAGRKLAYIRRDLAGSLAALLAQFDGVPRLRPKGAGNRASGIRLEIEGAPELFLRFSRRGGMIGLLLRRAYVGFRPRPVLELAIAAEALRRGIPVAEPVAALAERIAPFMYRGAFVTRAMAGMTLWEFLQSEDGRRLRDHVLRLAHRAIAVMHEQGLLHGDLNLHNLFVTRSADVFAVVILDLDKARLLRDGVPARLRRRNLKRLARSARKLDREGRYLSSDALAILTGD